jgi:hypothetical protein
MTCPHTSTLGVYLLGALEPEERSTFESHLYGCDICRAELVRLAPLPGLLNQISMTDFEESTEPPAPALDPVPPLEPAEPLPAEVPEEPVPPVRRLPLHRRPAWRIAVAAAAAVLVVIGGFLGYSALQGSGSDEHTVTWSAVDPNSGVHADVQLTERSWGTDIKVWMSDVSGSKECRLVVMARDGYRDKPGKYVEIAGWWTSSHSKDDDIPGSTSIDLASINRLEIMDGDNMLVGINSGDR